MPYALRKRTLVTGGAGFLGSHLCERLLARGDDVLCVDNFFTGTKDNIVQLLDFPHFEVLRHDVTFPLYVEVDEIYNLACPASPIHYQFDPVQTTKTSVHGAINMLGLAKRVKAKIFQASTSEVYGDPEVHPSARTTGAASTPSGCAPATTRASAAPRRSSSTTAASTPCASRSHASSTPMAPRCTPTTAGWSPTSSSRR
jgi:UDP-glucuronate decarboxylase